MAEQKEQNDHPSRDEKKEAVAFFIFNRPDLTEQVFREIARYRPERLLVVADGPRSPADRSLCEKTRAVIDRVDWECEVLRNFSDENMGCKRRVSSGLTWVFEQCERAIILEDDCLPDPTFFTYCAALLEYYADDERVMHIGGSNFRPHEDEGGATYRFSRHSDIWGWATWRRAFACYDVEMKSWLGMREAPLQRPLGADALETEFWTQMFDQTMYGQIDSWDFQWHYALFRNNGISCVPKVNLISNLGWGTTATHTISGQSAVAALPTGSFGELRHPAAMAPDEESDSAFFKARYYDKALFEELQKDVELERRREEKAPQIRATAAMSVDGNSLAVPYGLTGGCITPAALDATSPKQGWLGRVLRRLCRIKQVHWLNGKLHKATLMGMSALSEMNDSLLGMHFAIPTLLSDSDQPIVFDVGSGQGDFARRIVAAHPASEVYAFEPNADLEPPGPSDEIHFYRLACGAASGPATLYKSPPQAGGPHASLSKSVARMFATEESASEVVESIPIDSFVSKQELPRIDLLKVTVGGTEWNSLFGALETINRKRVLAVVFRFGPKQAITGTPMLYFFDLLQRFIFYRVTPDKLTRMDRYDFLSCEVYADQYILAVSSSHPRRNAIRDLSRR